MAKPGATDLTHPQDDGQTPLDADEALGLRLDGVITRADLDLAEERNIDTGLRWARRAIYLQAIRAADAHDYRALLAFVRR